MYISSSFPRIEEGRKPPLEGESLTGGQHYILLQNMAMNIGATDDWGRSAFFITCEKRNKKISRLFLEKLSIESMDFSNLKAVLRTHKVLYALDAFVVSAYKGYTAIVLQILEI